MGSQAVTAHAHVVYDPVNEAIRARREGGMPYDPRLGDGNPVHLVAHDHTLDDRAHVQEFLHDVPDPDPTDPETHDEGASP